MHLRGQTLRNRIVFGAHTTNMAEDGLPGERITAIFWNARWAGQG